MLGRIWDWVKAHPKTSIAIGLALAAILYFALRPTPRTYEYVGATVDRGEVVRRVTASGKLRALNTIKVGAEVSGQITRVFVDFNSPVTAGQVLAEIDPTRVKARVQQARAQVALAQAALAQAEASGARAQSEISIQEREFGRRAQLAERGFLSKSALDNASSVLSAARANIRTTAAQAASARAQIAQANAELSSAELDLSRTTIVAPASGVIINKLVEPGTTVAASFQTPNLFEIAADTTRMQVEASVDEADIGQVREGQPVRFTVDSYPGETFAASVRQIRKAATETQNVVSYLVILDVDNKDGKLLPGMTANVEIITGQKANVTRVPTTALRFRPRTADMPKDKAPPATTATVFVASADPYKPTRRVVALGLQGEDFVEITKGLAPGDKIIVRSRSTVKKPTDESAGDEADNATDE
jgi:HlyD family secretion protein